MGCKITIETIYSWFATSRCRLNENTRKINDLFKLAPRARDMPYLSNFVIFFCSPEHNWIKIFGYTIFYILHQIEIDFFLMVSTARLKFHQKYKWSLILNLKGFLIVCKYILCLSSRGVCLNRRQTVSEQQNG